MEKKEFLTLNEVRAILGVSEATVWRWVNKGFIAKYKNPRNKRVFYKLTQIPDKNIELLSTKEVCAELKISRQTLYILRCKKELVPLINTNGTILYSRSQIEQYEEQTLAGLVQVSGGIL